MVIMFFTACQTKQEKTYNRLKSYIDNIKVVNTHEHHFPTLDNPTENTSFFMNLSYFVTDVICAGLSSDLISNDDTMTTDEVWTKYENYYNYGRSTSYHASLIYGYKKLYGFDKYYVTKEDAISLEGRVKENYTNNYRKWFDSAFNKCNFEIMLVDQWWNHYNVEYDTMYYALVFRTNSLVTMITKVAETKVINDVNLLKLLGCDPIPARTIDEYISVMDSVFKIFMMQNMVSLKNSLAYNRTIEFDFVTHDEATKLFVKNNLTPEESKKLQDYMFHWLIEKSIERDFPIQIHTGYLNGTGRMLDYGHPMKLLPLFIRYPKAKFVLFHGAYPWTSDFVSLGKHFPNVYLDIVWLPQISRTEAIRTLHEIFDCVPYNKISWGGDVRTIEESAGSLEIGKEVVATVLAERIEKGWLEEDLACDMARKLFRENAIDIYKLDIKRNITK